ncbi:MAG: hypothetical protein Q9191_003895 [Dirinaria sp. TL-2023a]
MQQDNDNNPSMREASGGTAEEQSQFALNACTQSTHTKLPVPERQSALPAATANRCPRSAPVGIRGRDRHKRASPTSSSSEAPVSMAEGTMPWETENAKHDAKHDEHFKYQYHPGGDPNKAPKDAPSALHSVIVPNVTLPKVGGNDSGS